MRRKKKLLYITTNESQSSRSIFVMFGPRAWRNDHVCLSLTSQGLHDITQIKCRQEKLSHDIPSSVHNILLLTSLWLVFVA